MNENNNANELYDLIANIKSKLDSPSDETPNDSTYNQTTEETSQKAETQNNFDFSNMDVNTILKMQNIFSKFNSSSPKKQLLYSLKPFLNKTRQDSLGEYITILSLMDAFDLFSKKGSDSNV